MSWCFSLWYQTRSPSSKFLASYHYATRSFKLRGRISDSAQNFIPISDIMSDSALFSPISDVPISGLVRYRWSRISDWVPTYVRNSVRRCAWVGDSVRRRFADVDSIRRSKVFWFYFQNVKCFILLKDFLRRERRLKETLSQDWKQLHRIPVIDLKSLGLP